MAQVAGRGLLGADPYGAPAAETLDPQSSFHILDPTAERNVSGAVRPDGLDVRAGTTVYGTCDVAGGVIAPDGHNADGRPGMSRFAADTLRPFEGNLRTQATGGHVVIRRVVPGSSRGVLTAAPLQPNVRRNQPAQWDGDVAIG